MIEMDQLPVMGQGPGPVLSQSSALGRDPRDCCVFLVPTRAADSPQTMAHQGVVLSAKETHVLQGCDA